MLSRIYLIRHGRTDGNRNHWYYGSTDLPLTEEGLGEISEYAKQGIYPEIPDDADFYTTGLVRTDQTLEAIYGKRDHSAIPKLQEINFGKAECMTYDELKQFENFDEWAWDTTGKVRIVDDAETSEEFHVRIHEGLKELLGKHRLKEWAHRNDKKDAVSVVVCHGGVIACIMEKLFPAVCGSMWDWLPEPGFGYAVDFQDSDPYMYSKINDIGRLGLGLYRLPLRGGAGKSLCGADTPDGRSEQNPVDTSPRQIDHKAARALIDTQMEKGHGYFELEFLAWPDAAAESGSGETVADTVIKQGGKDLCEPDLKRLLKAVKTDLVKRYDRSRYYLTAIADASMLGEVVALIRKTGAGYLDRLAVSGVERYYSDYPEDENIEPETLADKRIDGPEGESGRPVNPKLEGVWTELGKLKKAGVIRKAGLAFNGSATLLDDLLKDRQEIDYVELPVNYKMGLSDGDLAQKYYTISRRRYKEILVRSPFAGGELASIDDAAPHGAIDWALRYVLSFPFVVTCVASTGDPDHAREDMDAAERFRPLTEEDRERLKQAVKGIFSA